MTTILNAAFTAFAAVLAGLFLVTFGALFGRLHPVIDLFGQFLLPAIVGGAAVALIALLLGRYQFAAIAVVALAANLAIAWPWLQQPASVEANGPRFKLLLFNVYFYNPRLDLVAKLARDTKADIVVLLEVIPQNRPALSALEADYPYRLECWQDLKCDSVIFSRYPLTYIGATLPAPYARRSLAAAAVDVKGRKLNLFAAHLILPFPFVRYDIQPAQADDTTAAVASVEGARILVGDFNAVTWGAIIAKPRERAGLTPLTGAGGSWPTFLPRHMSLPIDHMLASKEIALISRELHTIAGSDHRAVLAEIAFKE